MAKFVLFLLLLVPLVAVGNWLLAHQGSVTIDWMQYEVVMAPGFAALLVGAFCLLASLAALILWQVVTWPERRKARRRYRTLARGLRELTHGVSALALGNEKRAQQSLKKAAQLLPGEPLPQLLTAQLLQRQGKHEAARRELRGLMKHEATAAIAGHRLIEQHLDRKEWAAALSLTEEMRRDAPRDRWLVLTLIDLCARLNRPAQILDLTEGWQFQSPLSREERHRYAALAYYQTALAREEPGARRTALRHAIGYAPDFLPALTLYATLLMDDGEVRQARKLLRQAWLKQPDVLLIAPILRGVAKEAPRLQPRLLAAYMPAARGVPHHLLAAEYALAHERPAEAEESLNKALAVEESRAALALMSEAQKRMHGDDAANRFLSRAMHAPIDERWICQRCGSAQEQWHAHCPNCESFDTLARGIAARAGAVISST
ncbi:MAG: heme biosynthesis HemY N-terminal domain-containing protein [Alphaproteobacteria bacterium]